MTEPATEDEVRWNGTALVVFLAFVALCGYLLWTRDAFRTLYFLNFLDLAILGLATFRTAHLLTFDKIFDFVREAFMDTRNGQLVKPTRGFRHMMYELFECLWCTGMWASVIMLTLYVYHPVGRFIVILFAIAGIGSLLQIISEAIAKH